MVAVAAAESVGQEANRCRQVRLGLGLRCSHMHTARMFQCQTEAISLQPPAGGLSRTLAAVAACPFTIVKTRMEYSGAGAPSLLLCKLLGLIDVSPPVLC